MIYIALTGLARHVIKELTAAKVRTVEIRSPNNFFALLGVQPGDRIFLTEASAPDIVPGTAGLIVAVRAIQNSSLPGHSVLDLFGGSGSTLIGCERTGRRAFLMEIDPLYCDVIVNRWEQFTGRKAARIAAPAKAGDGAPVEGGEE